MPWKNVRNTAGSPQLFWGSLPWIDSKLRSTKQMGMGGHERAFRHQLVVSSRQGTLGEPPKKQVNISGPDPAYTLVMGG